MESIAPGPKDRNNEVLERHFWLPFGYSVTFRWNGNLTARWEPDVPRIRTARAQRRFFNAYQTARRDFFQEVAAIVGGNVLVVDTDLKRVIGMETFHKPTRH
jgi:hypothetical protein